MGVGVIINNNNKMDVLDFIVNVLIEHEKKLDNIIERLERYTEIMDDMIKKDNSLLATNL